MADLDLPPIFEQRLVCRVIDQRVEECVLSFDVGEQRLGLVNSQTFQISRVNRMIRVDQLRKENNQARFFYLAQ
jgi:hypothetical protein